MSETQPTSPYGAEGSQGNDAPVAVNKCGKWNAWHDYMPGKKPTLYVTGECTFPSLGYTVTLEEASPQGINPTILILQKTVTPPSGVSGMQVETKMVRFELETTIQYKSVEIVPDNVVIPVKITS